MQLARIHTWIDLSLYRTCKLHVHVHVCLLGGKKCNVNEAMLHLSVSCAEIIITATSEVFSFTSLRESNKPPSYSRVNTLMTYSCRLVGMIYVCTYKNLLVPWRWLVTLRGCHYQRHCTSTCDWGHTWGFLPVTTSTIVL